jgi:hypothetical protein
MDHCRIAWLRALEIRIGNSPQIKLSVGSAHSSAGKCAGKAGKDVADGGPFDFGALLTKCRFVKGLAQAALWGLPKNIDCPRPLHKPKLMRLALLISCSQNAPLGAEVLDAVGREKLMPERSFCLLRKNTPACAESHIMKKVTTRITIGCLIRLLIGCDLPSSWGILLRIVGNKTNWNVKSV